MCSNYVNSYCGKKYEYTFIEKKNFWVENIMPMLHLLKYIFLMDNFCHNTVNNNNDDNDDNINNNR